MIQMVVIVEERIALWDHHHRFQVLVIGLPVRLNKLPNHSNMESIIAFSISRQYFFDQIVAMALSMMVKNVIVVLLKRAITHVAMPLHVLS